MPLPPPTQLEDRVFVNASVRFHTIAAVGFDMDYTLAIYKTDRLEKLIFDLAQVELGRLGYPGCISRMEYRPGGSIRGLVVDSQMGNVLKMDRYRYVGLAVHGSTEVDSESKRLLYANRAIPLASDRFHAVDTLFAKPEVDLFLQMVELMDQDPESFGSRDYAMVWRDVRHVVDRVHSQGEMKARVVEDLDFYVEEDPHLGPALESLRQDGRKLFLLTNSEESYTDKVMAHLLSQGELGSWTQFFDQVVVEARKPAFFETYTESEACDSLTHSDGTLVRRGGNYRELQARLGCSGDSILFVGDHIYGDVIRSKTHSFWRTMMIVPELDRELVTVSEIHGDVAAYHARLEDLAGVEFLLQGLRADPGSDPRELTRVQARAEALRAEVKAEEKSLDRRFHPLWGALFQEGGEVSLFGKQVLNYADLYTAKVSALARYAPDHWFHTPWEALAHWK